MFNFTNDVIIMCYCKYRGDSEVNILSEMDMSNMFETLSNWINQLQLSFVLHLCRFYGQEVFHIYVAFSLFHLHCNLTIRILEEFLKDGLNTDKYYHFIWSPTKFDIHCISIYNTKYMVCTGNISIPQMTMDLFLFTNLLFLFSITDITFTVFDSM